MDNILCKFDEEKKCLSINIDKQIGGNIFEDGYTFDMFTNEIKNSPEYNKIILNITSPGGSLLDGLNIYNFLELLKSEGKEIETNFIGVNASAATIIGMAADKRNIQENGVFMAHYASIKAFGKVEDLEKTVEEMKEFNKTIFSIYKQKTNLEDEVLEDILNKEKWLKGKEAVKLGFATDVIKNSKTKYSAKYFEEITCEGNLEELKNKIIDMTLDEFKAKFEINDDVDILEHVENLISEKDNLISQKEIELNNKVEEFNNIILKNNEEILSLNDTMKLKDEEIINFTNKLNDEILKNKQLQIDNVLKNAIETEKISENLKENYRKLLVSNFDDTKKLIESLQPQRTETLSDKISVEKEVIEISFSELSKKDPKALKELKENNFEKFNELFKKEFGRDY